MGALIGFCLLAALVMWVVKAIMATWPIWVCLASCSESGRCGGGAGQGGAR